MIMIDRILFLTARLKDHLIQLGVALPPAVSLHNNKILQLNTDFQHMSQVLANKKHDHLFQNAAVVFTALTSDYVHIQNLEDLLRTTEAICQYVVSY